ncbi:MAG TPA: YbaB/EbfC family nucleoid-associated protein [Clostridiales bacterium]|nr:YbaB/EbfC family nucleoid-associated protein [Clostridiales bacterium]
MAKGGFPGMGGGNIAQMMKQAQKMQQEIARVQEEIGNQEFEASVGGGAVKAIINGKKEFKSIVIDPACVDPDDVEMLQDLVLSAVNEAIKTAEEAMASAMESVTGGLKLGF